jgi:hypothetical protein
MPMQPRSLDLGRLLAPSAWRAVKERAWVGVTKTSHKCVRPSAVVFVVVVVSEVEDFPKVDNWSSLQGYRKQMHSRHLTEL